MAASAIWCFAELKTRKAHKPQCKNRSKTSCKILTMVDGQICQQTGLWEKENKEQEEAEVEGFSVVRSYVSLTT